MKKEIKKTDYNAPVTFVILTEEALPLCSSGDNNASGIDDYYHEEW